MKDSLSVHEFSKLSGISRTTLRYWDEIGLFRPARRNPDNNYRYYSPEQIVAINFISVLNDLKIPLKTIGEIEDKRTPQSIVGLIERHEKQLDIEMRRLQERQSIIHERLELIRYGMRVMGWPAEGECGEVEPPPVSVRHLPTKAFIAGPVNSYECDEEFYGAFMRFCNQSENLRVNLSYPIGGMYESFDNYLARPGRPDRFISVDPTGNLKSPEGEYLVGYARGYYGDNGDTPEKMGEYVKEHGLTLTGPVFVVFLHDEICVRDHSRYLSHICVAVTKKRL